ncbi:MAG: glycosyltransferase family 9 protein [Verrucomicrobia bacterium]|nr:glycosyltransferase family 9 protein [Verrucomicrobiota bacterium]
MPRILVLQLKRIGDLILTAPALAGLRSALPHSEIVLLTAANVADLARCIPSINRVIPYQAGRVNLSAWTTAMAGPWDACLDFTGTDRSALLTGLSHAKRRIGYQKFSSKQLRRLAFTEFCAASVRDLHTLDFHAALAAQFLKQPAPLSSDISPLIVPDGICQAAKQKLAAAGVTGPYVIIHPGTVRGDKLWLASRWAEVTAYLVKTRGLNVVLTGSGDGIELGHLEEMHKRLKVPVADLTGKLSLPELAGLIEECDLMLGVDSMAMHLAAMFQRPQVALFGPTNPFHWRPRHERAAVLLGDAPGPRLQFDPREKPHEMKDVSTVDVIGAIDLVLPNSIIKP